MRITKRQLRRIIREAMGPDRSRYGNDSLYVTTSQARGHGQLPRKEEEVVAALGPENHGRAIREIPKEYADIVRAYKNGRISGPTQAKGKILMALVGMASE